MTTIENPAGQETAATHRQGWIHSVDARIVLTTLTLSVLFGLALIFLVHHQMRRNAIREAEERAATLLDHNLAIHTYFTHQLKPAVFALADSAGAEAPFDPAWMSSTFAVRETMEYFRSLRDTTYYYKEAAVDARNPANEADEYEGAFIQRLNQDSTLTMDSRVRTFYGEPHLAVLRRGEMMEDTCLRCHSTPEVAPPALVEAYGPDRSFGREVGEAVSAISIRIPLSALYARADQVSRNLAGFLLAVFLGLLVIHLVLNHRLVAKPLQALVGRVESIAQDPRRLGEAVPLPPTRELREFSAAFNQMSFRLRDAWEELERRAEELAQEHLEAQRELIQTQSILQVAMDQSTAGIAIADAPDGRLRYVNDAGLGIRGGDRESVVNGVSIQQYVESWRILHFDGTPYADDEVPLARAVLYGETSSREFMIRRTPGEDRVVLANAAPVLGEDGEVEAGIVVFLDITERRAAEDELRESQARLRALTHRLETVRDEERKEIARELHDELGSALTVLKMDLDAMESEVPEGADDLARRLQQLTHQAEDLVRQVSRMSWELHDPVLETLGLDAAVEDAVEAWSQQASIDATADVSMDSLPPSPERDRATYRILQEALRNVRRHANASRVQVRLQISDGHLVLEVKDDGKGLPAPTVDIRRSFGIMGMRERARRLGGTLTIDPGDDGGTVVTARIPLDA